MTPQLNKDLNGFNRKDNTLRRAVKENPADRIELEIGDSKRPEEFIPQAKVMRWDNEVNLSVRRQKPATKGKQPTADVQGSHVTYDDDDETVHIYERPEVGEDGGLEIELHLKHKPDTNRFDFSIQTKGLNFYYQPALTEEEVANGAFQPENVIGSYAVYHATKRDNRVGGMEYKTGKFCHIYRPHITDAEGNETWGELELDEQSGTLTVVVPQAFLDKAVYPVVVDPTFGYTSVGGSTHSAFDSIRSYTATAPENGNAQSISLYVKATDSQLSSCALYEDSTNALVSSTDERSSLSSDQWNDYSFSSSEPVTNQDYKIAVWGESVEGIAVDSGGPGTYDDENYSGNWPDPLNPASYNWSYSIYATYTVASAPTVTTQAVSSIGETTATGNGNVTDDGGATITERGVCWSTSTGPTTADSKATAAGTTGAFTASMTGLTANTTYYVRAYAINSEGTSYGSEVTFTTTAAPEPRTCLPGYTYRKKITIAGQAGAGTDYQVKLLIGDTTGGDFNLGGNSANFPTGVNDGGDLTFTNEDSTVEYSFWVESVSGGVAEVWVKVGANLDTNQDIYIQYGNASASNKSDGEATFEFFDDFEDGVIDTNKWVKEAENGSITESGGYLRVGGGIQSGAYGWSSLGSSPGYTAFNDNVLMVRTRNSPSAIAEMAFRGDFAANNGYKLRSDARSGEGYATMDDPYSNWDFLCSADGTNITADQWYTMEIVALGGTVTAFRDGTFQAGTQVENCSGLTYQTAGQISLQNHYGDHADYDWVAVRKINATEPAFSSAGSEESCASGYDSLSIKVGGTFQTVTPKIKVGGTFVEKPVKIKQGGTFS